MQIQDGVWASERRRLRPTVPSWLPSGASSDSSTDSEEEMRPVRHGARHRGALVPQQAARPQAYVLQTAPWPYRRWVPRTEYVSVTSLPVAGGVVLQVHAFRHTLDGVTFTEPVAIVVGNVRGAKNVPVRVHDACFTSEVLGSLKCDCEQQLKQALQFIQKNGLGIIIYLQQEGRGIGLANKIAAYAMQEEGYNTVDANRMLGLPDDAREYSAAKDMLDHLGVESVQLLTNNPRKICELQKLGVAVNDRIPCLVENLGPLAEQYVQTKVEQMGHKGH